MIMKWQIFTATLPGGAKRGTPGSAQQSRGWYISPCRKSTLPRSSLSGCEKWGEELLWRLRNCFSRTVFFLPYSFVSEEGRKATGRGARQLRLGPGSVHLWRNLWRVDDVTNSFIHNVTGAENVRYMSFRGRRKCVWWCKYFWDYSKKVIDKSNLINLLVLPTIILVNYSVI